VRIDKSGWEIVPLPPIFKRYQHQETQVLPEKGGDPKAFSNSVISKKTTNVFSYRLSLRFSSRISHIILSQNASKEAASPIIPED